jgi:hypothetical protein
MYMTFVITELSWWRIHIRNIFNHNRTHFLKMYAVDGSEPLVSIKPNTECRTPHDRILTIKSDPHNRRETGHIGSLLSVLLSVKEKSVLRESSGLGDSIPDFTVSNSRLPFSSVPTTRRATVGVFSPASTRGWLHSDLNGLLYSVSVSKQMFFDHSYPWKRVPWGVGFQKPITTETCYSTRFLEMGLHVTQCLIPEIVWNLLWHVDVKK